MTPKEFQIAITEVKQYLHQDFPRIVGKEGEDHFKDSFHNEGFTDQNLIKWAEVKRRRQDEQRLVLKRGRTRRSQKYTKADRTRKILTGETGDLGDSIRWEADYNQVTFATDVEYAQAHNEGTTTAGRGRRTYIPKRQFMGPSEALTNKLKNILDTKIRQLLK